MANDDSNEERSGTEIRSRVKGSRIMKSVPRQQKKKSS